MSKFQLSEDAKYARSFDSIVECYDEPKEVTEAIVSLGYYGVPVNDERIKAFENGERFTPPPFSLTYDGMDGMSEKLYDSKEALIEAIKDHYEYWKSETSFGTDYGQWYINGCTMSEAGIKCDF